MCGSAGVALGDELLQKLRIVIVSIGTRGDVQPCVGLALALKARGHHPAICTITIYKYAALPLRCAVVDHDF